LFCFRQLKQPVQGGSFLFRQIKQPVQQPVQGKCTLGKDSLSNLFPNLKMGTVAEKVAVLLTLQSHFDRDKWKKMTDWREFYSNTE